MQPALERCPHCHSPVNFRPATQRYVCTRCGLLQYAEGVYRRRPLWFLNRIFGRRKRQASGSRCELCGREIGGPTGKVFTMSGTSAGLLSFLEGRRYVCSVCGLVMCLPCMEPGEVCPECGGKARYG